VAEASLAHAVNDPLGFLGEGKAAAAKKAGSMPKGVVPPQLRKPRAWVDFTLQHALQNGWETFTVFQTKKDKETGEKVEEEIEMPGSILHDGAYVYDGSVTDKTPAGKQLIHKDAMSLSKQRWAPKEKKGTHPELYEEFEASYVEEAVEAADDASETSSTKKVVVKMTAAEKAAAAEAKKAAKEEEKALKKAEKEAEKAAKKLEKEQEKAQKKAEKEAEKAAAKAAKDAAKKPVGKVVIPAAAVKKVAAPAAASTKAETPAAAVEAPKPIKVAAKKVVAAPKKEEWSCPADGMVHPWAYKGKQYLRNSDNEVWLKGADGGCGEWQGIYLPAEDRIDDSVEEPVFEDEE
jgi:chemotaxis protein histidine kinase CheA